jgi:hypothetical protein
MSDTPTPDTVPTIAGELTATTGTQEHTIAEVCDLFGTSDSTVRRALKEGRLKGVQRPTERGLAWYITEAAMLAAGFTKTALNAPERTEVATANLEAETLRREKTEAEHALELARVRLDYLERENARLTAQEAEARENLRKAIERIPLALPPAPARKWWQRKAQASPPTTPPSA